jgi:hypothetical protein
MMVRIQLKPIERKKMIIKKPLIHSRLRQTPTSFSWIDQRLVRNNYICHCSPDASALYLFLTTVGDRLGLSYYSDKSISSYISMTSQRLTCARDNLLKADLIAYEKPIYQVLSLQPPLQKAEPNPLPKRSQRTNKRVPNGSGQMVSVGELLRTALKKSNMESK